MIRRRALGYVGGVNRLIAYLRENLIIDFQGELTRETVRELVAGDESRDVRALLAKLTSDEKVEDMLLVLADCLVESVHRSLTDEVMREQLRMYLES